MGYYYRIPCDDRDLNYEKYFASGEDIKKEIIDYHSHNTYRLNISEMKELLLKLDIIKNDIKAVQ
jgi:UDP-glucose 4-epimerase